MSDAPGYYNGYDFIHGVRYGSIAPSVSPNDIVGQEYLQTSDGTSAGTILNSWLFDGTQWKKRASSGIPFVNIDLSIPRRNDFGASVQIYQQDLSTYPQSPIDQTYDLRLSIFPGDKRVFDMNPEFWLFRNVSRVAKKTEKFRLGGKKRVHPTDTVNILSSHRYNVGQHNNPYGILPRVTEVDANIHNHAVLGTPEWFGGSSASPDGTIFPFTPLTWFSNSKDISNKSINFPQPLHQGSTTSTFDASTGIWDGAIQRGAGDTIFKYFYTGNGFKKGGNNITTTYFSFALMVDNPDYDGGNQIPRKVMASNFVDFVVDYKVGTLSDPVDGILRKYALDWRIRLK